MIFYDKPFDHDRVMPIDFEYVGSILKMVYRHYLEKAPHYAQFIEHELYVDVMKSIATGKVKDPVKMARECLKTLNIPFNREYKEIVKDGQSKPA